MKKNIKFRFAGIGVVIAILAFVVFGAAVMLLWNALMPRIFGLPELDYLQAVGLLILTRILFGGIEGGLRTRHGAREYDRVAGHGNKLREKWMNMSEEERKEFIAKEKDFFKSQRRFSHLHEFFDDDEKTEQNTETGTKKDSGNE
ncbi:MAG: hypothetical protein LBQ94_11925 [Treponema sp.]|jgi:hypothetical protein|nr:hypothetical protein [Treponema sp.]